MESLESAIWTKGGKSSMLGHNFSYYDIDQYRDSARNTLLHIAITENCAESVDFLFRVGANPFLKNAVGLTPLALAVETGNQILIQSIERWMHFIASSVSVSFLHGGGQQGQWLRQRSRGGCERGRGRGSGGIGGGGGGGVCSNYTAQSLQVFEDYVDWAYSSRRFYLQQLLDLCLAEEREAWGRLSAHSNDLRQWHGEAQALDVQLGRKQFSLSSQLFDQESKIRAMRGAVLGITERVASLRALLSGASSLTFWKGAVELRLHKGLLLEIWRPRTLLVRGEELLLQREEGQGGWALAVHRILSLHIVKERGAGMGEKASLATCLALEYQPRGPGRGGKKVMRLRFPPGRSSRPLSPLDSLVNVLKVLNRQIQVSCEIDGSRRVGYVTGRELGAKGKAGEGGQQRAALSPFTKEGGRGRRNTFDSVLPLLSEDLLTGALSGGSARGARSYSTSWSSGGTSHEASSLSSSFFLSLVRKREEEGKQVEGRQGSRDDQSLSFSPPQPTPFLPFRHSLSYSPRRLLSPPSSSSSAPLSPLPPLPSFSSLPLREVEEVDRVEAWRERLVESLAWRESAQGELERAVQEKESLRAPLHYLRRLRQALAASNPPGLFFLEEETGRVRRREELLLSLESFSALLGGGRGQSKSGVSIGSSWAQEGGGALQSLPPDQADTLRWLCRSLSAEPSPRPSLADPATLSISLEDRIAAEGEEGWRESVRRGRGEDHGSEGEEEGSWLSLRAFLGPPPETLRREHSRVLELLERLWVSGERFLDQAERLSQLLMQREQIGKELQVFLEVEKESGVRHTSDLIDIDF